jgi:hypothetical protein
VAFPEDQASAARQAFIAMVVERRPWEARTLTQDYPMTTHSRALGVDPYDQAQAMLRDCASLVGEQRVEEVLNLIHSQPRDDSGHFVSGLSAPKSVGAWMDTDPLEAFFNHIADGSDLRLYLINLHRLTGSAPFNRHRRYQWSESMAVYEGWIERWGQTAIHEFGERIRSAPKRIIEDGGMHYVTLADPREFECYENLTPTTCLYVYFDSKSQPDPSAPVPQSGDRRR